MAIVRVQGEVHWQVRRGQSGQAWIGVCEPLKLTVQGETWGDLMEAISDTLDAVMLDLAQSNKILF